MTYTPVIYTATSGQTTFNIPFSLLKNEYLYVATALPDEDFVPKLLAVDYGLSGTTIVFNTGLTTGTKVKIWRVTDRTPLVDFSNVSNLNKSNLGLLSTQISNVAEEQESDITKLNSVVDAILATAPELDAEELSNTYSTILGQIADIENQIEDFTERSVLAYGAVGDGITDDSDAIIEAITDLPAEGGTIFFPANRTFKLTKPLISTGDANSLKEITMIGYGTPKRRTTSPTVDYANILCDAGGLSNVTFIDTNARQFNLIGISAKSLGSKSDGLNTSFMKADRSGVGTLSYGYSVIDRLLLSQFSGNGLELNGIVNVSVSNYNAFSIGKKALRIDNNLDGLVSTTLFARDCYWSGCGGGLYLGNAVDCYFDGLIAEYCGNTTHNSGTYSITSNVVTCVIPNHGLTNGLVYPVVFTSGGANGDNNYAPVTVVDVNTFTFSKTFSNTNGNCYVLNQQDSAVYLHRAVRHHFRNLYLEANYRNFIMLDASAMFENWDIYAENAPSLFPYIGLDTAQRGFNHYTTNKVDMYHRQGLFKNRRGTAISGTYSLVSNVVTVTTASAHGLFTGQEVFIDFTSGGRVNSDDVFAITVTSSTTFTFPLTASDTNGNCTTQTTYLTPSFTTLQMNNSGQLSVTRRDSSGTGTERRLLTSEKPQRVITGAVSGSSHTLSIDWTGHTILVDHTSAVNVTLPSSLPVGSFWRIVQYNTGQITFITSGTTLVSRPGHTKTNGRYAVVELEVTATNQYLLSGDTAV